jgi:hypothetical protein
MPIRSFDDAFVYGPITEEEFNNLKYNHRMTFINGQRYVGLNVYLEELADRLIERPAPEPYVPTIDLTIEKNN